jgi:anti-anti-sigma factor
MVISSRTPEGTPNHCPLCGSDLKVEPSDPSGDAPCPRCGHLLWFTWDDLVDVQVIKPTSALIQPELLERLVGFLAVREGMRLVLDLDNVQYISSPILGALIKLKKHVSSDRGRLRLRNIHPDLREVFRITRLEQVFIIDD